jgi:hypothetical protein
MKKTTRLKMNTKMMMKIPINEWIKEIRRSNIQFNELEKLFEVLDDLDKSKEYENKQKEANDINIEPMDELSPEEEDEKFKGIYGRVWKDLQDVMKNPKENI